MGRRGPAPLPQAVKKTRGTYRADRDGGADDAFSDKRPTCPSFLGQAAKKEWRRLVNELHDAGLLRLVDRSMLAAYCDSYGRWVEATVELQQTSLVAETAKGYRYPEPLLKIAENAKSEMLRIGREFGLTPSARARVIVNKPGEPKQLSLADEIFALLELTEGGQYDQAPKK